MSAEQHPAYIAVTSGISGYFAVLLIWDEELRFYDVWNTGFGRYAKKEQAEHEGMVWAEAEELPYGSPFGTVPDMNSLPAMLQKQSA